MCSLVYEGPNPVLFTRLQNIAGKPVKLEVLWDIKTGRGKREIRFHEVHVFMKIDRLFYTQLKLLAVSVPSKVLFVNISNRKL